MTEKKDGMVNLPPEAVTAMEQVGLSTEELEKASATILTGKGATNIQTSGDVTYNLYGQFLTEKIKIKEDEIARRVKEYLENIRDKYDKIKTVLYRDQPRPFNDVYVCNDIEWNSLVVKNKWMRKTMEDATAKKIGNVSHFVVISGTGGLGKSMMMRHLLLDAVDNYEEYNLLPVLMSLKEYFSPERLEEYVRTSINDFLPDNDCFDQETIASFLAEGKCLLLFDGLDELNPAARNDFEVKLDKMTYRYKENLFIVSSRPYSKFMSLSRFTEFYLKPFNKEKALNLVDKLEFRADTPEIKRKFQYKLEHELIWSHSSFTENPLLLTIMMMTYEQYGEVPSKMYMFYQEAYATLSQKHDADKGLTRKLNTGLTPHDFERYLAEFCTRTFFDHKFSLTKEEFDEYFYELNEYEANGMTVSAEDFRKDLVDNMCLMYFEDQKYCFTHRSFQEYFCAEYFSHQDEEFLWDIGQEFDEQSGTAYCEKTFGMLYEMKPRQIEKHIFLSKLEELFQECGNAKKEYYEYYEEDSEYMRFLEIAYPTIYYDVDEVNDESVNLPDSFLLYFIVRHLGLLNKGRNLVLPYVGRFVLEEYVYVDEDDVPHNYEGEVGIVKESEFDQYVTDFQEWECELPETIGYNLGFQPGGDDLSDIYNDLVSESFPLKQQYRELQKYYEGLKNKQENRRKGKSLFDKLR